jgi:glycosyltransferase involved in cell wall biosynthesis
MHGSVLGFFAYGALQTREVRGKDVLEVGSLDVNGTVRPMVEARGPASYLGVDIVGGPGVDRVADAAGLVATFGPDAFDVVISTEMLEHAGDWQGAVLAMAMVLRPGGVLVWTTRSPGFHYHHPPDRWRYTQQAMATILDRLGLEPVVLADDPEHPGVFVKARKPSGWVPSPDLLNWRAGLGEVPGVTPMREPLKLLGRPVQPDGCGYYRFWQPWAQLARASGHLAVIPPPGQHEYLPDDDQAAEFDLVAQQRPAGRAGVLLWRRWKALGGPKLVYETDDDLLHADPSGLPQLLDADRLATIRECLAMADLVTTSTEPLAEALREHNGNVAVVPNHIHEGVLKMERPRRERVTLNWAGGLTHLQDLELVRDPLREVLDQTGAGMHFLGWDFSPVLRRACRFTPWQDDVWDYYKAIDGDVGVIPLADTAFNRARTPIKALEYAALGIPVVASDIEPYRGFVVDGVTGYLARTEADWQARLTDLIHDEAARVEMGAKAKDVAREWTIQAGWRKWAGVYERLCGWGTTTEEAPGE